MSDANQGQEDTVEAETTTVDAQPENKAEEEVKPQTVEADPKLPDGVKERTAEEFEKLKAKNKELADKLAQVEAPEQVERPSFYNVPTPSTAQYTGLSQEQINQQTKSFVDQDGYVDVASLNAVLNEANQRALRAEEAARRTQQEVQNYNHTREVTETYKEYPELNPDKTDVFDSKYYDMVTNHIYGQAMKGTKTDFLSAAKYVAENLYNPKEKKQQEQAKVEQEKETSKTKRSQATSTVGQGKGQPEPVDHEELVDKSRKGDMDAIGKRLNASGY